VKTNGEDTKDWIANGMEIGGSKQRNNFSRTDHRSFLKDKLFPMSATGTQGMHFGPWTS